MYHKSTIHKKLIMNYALVTNAHLAKSCIRTQFFCSTGDCFCTRTRLSSHISICPWFVCKYELLSASTTSPLDIYKKKTEDWIEITSFHVMHVEIQQTYSVLWRKRNVHLDVSIRKLGEQSELSCHSVLMKGESENHIVKNSKLLWQRLTGLHCWEETQRRS